MTPESLLFTLTLLCYLVGSVSYHAHLFAGSEAARRTANISVWLGVIAHTAAIGVWCTAHRGESILRDAGMPYSLVAYFLAIVQSGASLKRSWNSLGSLTLPLAFIAESYAGVRTPWSATHAASPVTLWQSPVLRPHVVVVLLGFTAFALAFCLAVIYLVQSRLLKSKQIKGVFSRLPPLDNVSQAAHWLAAVGFSMFTLGIITGVMAAPHSWGPSWWLSAHTLANLGAWSIYAIYLAVSLLLGWQGRKTTYFLIAGFLVVLVAFFFSTHRNPAPHAAPASARIATPLRAG